MAVDQSSGAMTPDYTQLTSVRVPLDQAADALVSPDASGRTPIVVLTRRQNRISNVSLLIAVLILAGGILWSVLAGNFLLISAPVVSIRGRVTNGMTGGPPVGASVSALWTPYMGGDGIPAQVSKQNGAFEIRGLAPGTYTLRASFIEDKLAFEGEQTVEVGNQGAQDVQIAALPDFAAAGHVKNSSQFII